MPLPTKGNKHNRECKNVTPRAMTKKMRTKTPVSKRIAAHRQTHKRYPLCRHRPKSSKNKCRGRTMLPSKCSKLLRLVKGLIMSDAKPCKLWIVLLAKLMTLKSQDNNKTIKSCEG